MQERNKILLLENDSTSKKKFMKVLETWGCDVHVAIDGVDVIDKLKKDFFQLAIINFNIEEVDGIELIKEAKFVRKETEILFVAKTPSMENAIDALKNGAVDFLVKPIVSEQLMLILQKVFHKQKISKKHNKNKKKNTEIIGKNKNLLKLLELAKKVAKSNATILIQGESGTGKELFANFIHQNSKRAKNSFIALNCAVLPENLLESELFGHEKGAFTGAIAKKIGKFELANNGTLFLDEITEMQFNLQAKLLRVIQERELDRIGGTKPVPVDIRIIASTNKDIAKAVEKNEFREDLFYRLNVIPLKIPPLRYRKDDIEILSKSFIEKYNEINGSSVKTLTKKAIEELQSHLFKGNVRELENIIQRATLISNSDTIEKKDLFLNEDIQDLSYEKNKNSQIAYPDTILSGSLKDIEKKVIFHTLDKTQGNRTHASKILGISVRTIRNKLNEYNNERPLNN